MVIRMRHTRAHTKNRRSHHALKTPTLSTCTHCGASRRPHHMCLECGYYNGRQVLDLASKKAAREGRLARKREAMQAQSGSDTPAVADETAPAAATAAPAESTSETPEDTKK